MLATLLFLLVELAPAQQYLVWDRQTLLHATEGARSVQVIAPSRKEFDVPVPIPCLPCITSRGNRIYLAGRGETAVHVVEGKTHTSIRLDGNLMFLYSTDAGVLASTHKANGSGFARSFTIELIKGKEIVGRWSASNFSTAACGGWFFDLNDIPCRVERGGKLRKLASFAKSKGHWTGHPTLFAGNNYALVVVNEGKDYVYVINTHTLIPLPGDVRAGDVCAYKDNIWILIRRDSGSFVCYVSPSGKYLHMPTAVESAALPVAGPDGLVFVDRLRGEGYGEIVSVAARNGKLSLLRTGDRVKLSLPSSVFVAYVNRSLLVVQDNGLLKRYRVSQPGVGPAQLQ